jgi:UDP-N-acetylmuramoyl-L-alanyl-D-glutamate--2,6-diaminopimelate ligase
MNLQSLLNGISEAPAIMIGGLNSDSRKIQAGEVFVALQGAHQHGLVYAQQAMANGAAAILYDPDGVDAAPLLRIPCIAVADLEQRLGDIAAHFYQQPSQQLSVIGITGTNGKTTISQFLAQSLDACGLVGTLGWGDRERLQATGFTTPDALQLQWILQQFVQQQRQWVVMEVSSHGLEQGRVNGVAFQGAIFSNLTRDHLDYHGSMASYLKAKLKLFEFASLQFAVVNLDDVAAEQVLHTIAGRIPCWGFSIQGQTHVLAGECLLAEQIEYSNQGIRFHVRWGHRIERAVTPVVGSFNLQNAMSVLCTLLALGWSFEQAIAQLARLQPVVGRMERFGGDGLPTVLVDYAHTPDALEQVLRNARNDSRLWVVFGCGGDRDNGKRAQMGAIAQQWADQVIITDDNPRSEAPQAIVADILSGCRAGEALQIIHDRKAAIQQAIRLACAADCIVVAGKGHENYQEINGIRLPFRDQDVVREALAQRRAAA